MNGKPGTARSTTKSPCSTRQALTLLLLLCMTIITPDGELFNRHPEPAASMQDYLRQNEASLLLATLQLIEATAAAGVSLSFIA